jgi:hypothetical protein
MHRPPRRSFASKQSLKNPAQAKEKPRSFLGYGVPETYVVKLYLVEQLLEIIFTFFTVKVDEPEDTPPAAALLPLAELAALASLLLPITRI